MRRLKDTWIRLSRSGTAVIPGDDPRRNIVTGVNKISLVIVLINATVGIVACAVTRSPMILAGVLLEMVFMSLPLALNYRRKHAWASVALYFIMSVATGYFCCYLGRLVEAQLTIVYLIGVALYIFPTSWGRVFGVGLALVVIAFVEVNYRYGFIPPVRVDERTQNFLRWAAYAVVIALVIFTFDLFWKSNRRLLAKLKHHAAEVEANLRKEEEEHLIKDKFISNATHEMRVSFYSIFAIITILYKMEKRSGDHEMKRCIDDLRVACKYSKSIVDNILTFERFKAGLPVEVLHELIDLRMVLMNIVDIYRYLADEKKVRIHLEMGGDLDHHILGDEVKIRQIIINLLHNAIKFTNSGTTVTIRARNTAGVLHLSIADQGEGVRPEDLQKIFKPFVTRNPEGLGLGLFIVKELVELLDGGISVANNTGKGATFTIYLPVPEYVMHPAVALSLS